MQPVFLSLIIFVSSLLFFMISLQYPDWFSDSNSLLKNFINHEYLAFMGIIVTISLASAANIHIELNRIEEKIGVNIFSKSRKKLKISCALLIISLIISFIIVFVKGVGFNSNLTQSVINSSSIINFIFVVCLMWDLIFAAFDIPANVN